MSRSKFNVDKDNKDRTCNGIVFDSKMEMRYYKDVLCPGVESGSVQHYELQKKYELQPWFVYDGKKKRPINYVADFYIEYADGSKIVIDIKGFADNTAKLKRKLFWYRYPDVKYIWLTYIEKWGGWIEYDRVKELRDKARKERNKKENEKDGEEHKESIDQCD